MIKFIYKLFIGVLLATTIGMGIETFYQKPVMPEYPVEKYPYNYSGPVEEKSTLSPQSIKEQQTYDREIREYTKEREIYDRNTAVIAVSLSLVILVLSLTVLAKLDVIADGLLLGGIFTLLYGIIRSFGSGEQGFIFVTTLVGLVTAVILGYIHFILPEKK